MSEEKKGVIHLTCIGYQAGLLYCSMSRLDAIKKGDRLAHYATWFKRTDEEILADPEVCEGCKEVLRAVISEEE